MVVHIVARFAGHAFAVDQKEDVLTAEALEIDACAKPYLVKGQPRDLLRQQVSDVGQASIFDLCGGNHLRDDGRLHESLRGACGGDDHFVQVELLHSGCGVRGHLVVRRRVSRKDLRPRPLRRTHR